MASYANLTLPTRSLLIGFANNNRAKHDAVLAVITGQASYREAAKEAGVSAMTVFRWVRDFRACCYELIERERLEPRSLVRGVDDEHDPPPRPEPQGPEGDF
jgi:hypothetical protein